MPEPLKLFFDRSLVARIADDLVRAWPPFPRASFVRAATQGLDELELLDRGRLIARALANALPKEYEEALAILLRSLGPPLTSAEGNGMEPFRYMPHSLYIAEHGLEHPRASLDAQRELTKRFSCEFSVRPFIERDPEGTLAIMHTWTRDPDEHVRRLASEGTRPRLPWAPRLRGFQKDPRPALALLEALKDDPSEYVRRSVANHLNDVAKDHPDLAIATCARWMRGATPQRARLVEHALRSLVRAGHADAIRLLGGDHEARVEVDTSIAPARVPIGGKVAFTVEARNEGRADATVVLGLRIHFVKAHGSTSPKTFKLPTARIPAGGTAILRKTVSLRQHTTRTHYPGTHKVEVVVNGEARRAGRFVLTD